MRKTMLMLACLAAVGGCGQAAEEAANKEFDENFVSSCNAAAAGGRLSPELAAQACDCALAKINERYSTAEKLILSDEQAQPIAAECFAEVAPAAG